MVWNLFILPSDHFPKKIIQKSSFLAKLGSYFHSVSLKNALRVSTKIPSDADFYFQSIGKTFELIWFLDFLRSNPLFGRYCTLTDEAWIW